jgi:hypothetical protein
MTDHTKRNKYQAILNLIPHNIIVCYPYAYGISIEPLIRASLRGRQSPINIISTYSGGDDSPDDIELLCKTYVRNPGHIIILPLPDGTFDTNAEQIRAYAEMQNVSYEVYPADWTNKLFGKSFSECCGE